MFIRSPKGKAWTGRSTKTGEQSDRVAILPHLLMIQQRHRHGKRRQQYCFEVGENKTSIFADLWDRRTDPEGESVKNCTIPTATLSCTHVRRPNKCSPRSMISSISPHYLRGSQRIPALSCFDSIAPKPDRKRRLKQLVRRAAKTELNCRHHPFHGCAPQIT